MACAEDGAPGGADAALATSAVVFAFYASSSPPDRQVRIPEHSGPALARTGLYDYNDHEVSMSRSFSVAAAKAHFSECLKEAEDGEPVIITRHGKPVAALVPAEDLERLRRLRATGPEGGLASVAGKFADVPEFPDQLDEVMRSRDSRSPLNLDEG